CGTSRAPLLGRALISDERTSGSTSWNLCEDGDAAGDDCCGNRPKRPCVADSRKAVVRPNGLPSLHSEMSAHVVSRFVPEE
ncbi:hypothetical protein, partial [Escherichia coli]|uniref:hypothetical protein n=1 Tax=Escherichia coli TaxID=562 RepID=UPI001952CCF7